MKDIKKLKSALMRGSAAWELPVKSFGVLIPMIETPHGLSLLFEVRAAGLKRQPGEICFPGGSTLDGEPLSEAAVREASEELLIDESAIEVIYEMNVINVYSGGILMPVVGLLHGYEYSFSKDEVAEVFAVPLSFFMDNDPVYFDIEMRSFPEANFPYDRIPGGEEYRFDVGHREVCFYSYGNRHIWGLTAGIVHDLVKKLRAGGYSE